MGRYGDLSRLNENCLRNVFQSAKTWAVFMVDFHCGGISGDRCGDVWRIFRGRIGGLVSSDKGLFILCGFRVLVLTTYSIVTTD